MAIGAGFSVYASECKPFHFTSLVMICLIVERTHNITKMKGQVKRRNSSETENASTDYCSLSNE